MGKYFIQDENAQTVFNQLTLVTDETQITEKTPLITSDKDCSATLGLIVKKDQFEALLSELNTFIRLAMTEYHEQVISIAKKDPKKGEVTIQYGHLGIQPLIEYLNDNGFISDEIVKEMNRHLDSSTVSAPRPNM